MATLTLTDEQIQRDVLDELKWDMRVRPNEVGVSVKDGIVTLTGWVDSYAKKLAAEAAGDPVGTRSLAVGTGHRHGPQFARRLAVDQVGDCSQLELEPGYR